MIINEKKKKMYPISNLRVSICDYDLLKKINSFSLLDKKFNFLHFLWLMGIMLTTAQFVPLDGRQL